MGLDQIWKFFRRRRRHPQKGCFYGIPNPLFFDTCKRPGRETAAKRLVSSTRFFFVLKSQVFSKDTPIHALDIWCKLQLNTPQKALLPHALSFLYYKIHILTLVANTPYFIPQEGQKTYSCFMSNLDVDHSVLQFGQ